MQYADKMSIKKNNFINVRHRRKNKKDLGKQAKKIDEKLSVKEICQSNRAASYLKRLKLQ